ncbi:hypothetical protein ACP275_08G088600 [Erythranthe tilingii]
MGLKGSKMSRVVSFRRLKGASSSSLITSTTRTTRRGYIPVAVGVDEETRRFMVQTKALSNEEFVQLFLCRSAEEYGFCNEGVLRIPYDAQAFEDWMNNTRAKHKIFRIQPTNTY